MNEFTFIHPKDYFSSLMINNGHINQDYIGKYAKSSAIALHKSHVPVKVIESVYWELYNYYQAEKYYNNFQDITDIMRSRIYAEPYTNHKFLVHIIDIGLLVVENEEEINVFFLHLNKILEYSKNMKNYDTGVM